ncbi:MAG TPA: MBL fold metallo-hydrolase [Sphingomicrobium sp.]|nr:MBL fold metallo-hydrolase [Sphingomicrobium sp.]
MRAGPQISGFFDEATSSVSYLVADPETRQAVVIDPVLDFDSSSGEVATRSAERILAAADEQGLSIGLVLETHPHADHLTAAPFFKERTGARVGIGAEVRAVQKSFMPLFGAEDIKSGGGDFDLLLEDGQRLPLGNLAIEVIATPGHTPACVSYKIDDAVFVGDTLFMPDYGTSRTDFPGGDARQLYRSIQRLLSLPADTRLFLCHDYKAPGRDEFAWETTVAEERANNVHIGGGVSEDDFVALREARDSKLSVPKLLLPAIQVNIRAGRFPPPEANGTSYLRIPVKLPQAALEPSR